MNQAGKNQGPPLLVPGLEVRVGQTLAGRYRVEERLDGAPHAGVLLGARHVHTREPVTLKILAAYSDAQRERLDERVTKARAAVQLRGEHVARVLDVGVTPEGVHFVATERLEGRTVEQELDARGRLPVDEAVRRVLEACEALAEAHALGLVHGEIRPSNLLLAKARLTTDRERVRALSQGPGAETEEPGTLKVLDFGSMSPAEASGPEGSSTWLGSPAYLAPEQIQDPTKVDARADVWAIGVVLYELLSGTLPFTSDTLSGILVSIVYDTPPLVTDAPYELATIVHRCLAKDPASRPPSIEALARELAPFAGTEGTRLSERVRLASERPAEGSAPPTALSLPAPEPTWDEPTRPSVRVRVAKKKRDASLSALALALGASAVGVAAWLSLAGPLAPKDGEPPPPMPATSHEPLAVTPPPPPEPSAPPDVAPPPVPPKAVEAAPVRPRATPPPPPPKASGRLPAGLPSTREPVREAPPRASDDGRQLFNERK